MSTDPNEEDAPHLSSASLSEREVAEDFRRQLQESRSDPRIARNLGRERVLTILDEKAGAFQQLLSHMLGNEENKQPYAENYIKEINNVGMPNPNDEPVGRHILDSLCGPIEAMIELLGFSLRGGVAYGVTTQTGIEASQHTVPLCGSSVITFHPSLITFCSQISKALALSFLYEDLGPFSSVDYSPASVFNRLKPDEALRIYWIKIVASYAIHGASVAVPHIIPDSGAARVTSRLLLRAMELFAMAHEYGHHVEQHSVTSVDAENGYDSDLHAQEFQADAFGAAIAMHIGAADVDRNKYAMSGSGAIVMLASWDLVQRARQILKTGNDVLPPSHTHPALQDRVDSLEREMAVKASPEYRQAFQHMRWSFSEIFRTLLINMKPSFQAMHENGVRPRVSGNGDWLP